MFWRDNLLLLITVSKDDLEKGLFTGQYSQLDKGLHRETGKKYRSYPKGRWQGCDMSTSPRGRQDTVASHVIRYRCGQRRFFKLQTWAQNLWF